MKEFNKLPISFKVVKTKKRNTTQKGANYEKLYELYERYYNAYKSDYDTNDELNEAEKKMFDCKQFELDSKIDKESKLDEEKKKLKTDCITNMVEL